MNEGRSNSLSYDIVVLGGGFAGAYCARNLGKRLGPQAATKVALIAEQNVLAFQPMLAEVVGASLSPFDVVTPLRQFCTNVNTLKGTVASVDLQAKTMSVDAGEFTPNTTVKFKHLVLALGSVVDVSKVPGMAEHGYILKYAWDAVKLRTGILERLEEANLSADMEMQKRLLTFVVVGGGYSGVETAGQMLDLMRDIKPLYKNLTNVPSRIVLIHSRDHLLPEIGPSLGNYAEKKLRKRGMEILLDERVTSVSAGRAYLTKGKTIDTHTVLSTVGNTTHPIIVQLTKEHSWEELKGRIVTDPQMRVKGCTDVWSIGDCAAIPLGTEPTCPSTAQFALRQGEQVAQNILNSMDDKPLKKFKWKSQGELATIGHLSAVANVSGFKFSGFIAWLMWRGIYVAKLPGLSRKIRVFMDWVLELFFMRDISLVTSPDDHADPIHNMHFENGDIIFRIGEPYFSVYIIKTGHVECKTADGKVAKTMGEGDALGGAEYAQENKWIFEAAAKDSLTLICVSRKVFRALRAAKFFSEKFPESQVVKAGNVPVLERK